MNVNLTVLFAALAEELSIGKAAARLNMSQPSFSAQIKKLEVQLGFKLYYRTPTGVALTSAGARIAPFAQNVAQASKALRDEARAVTATVALDTVVGSCFSSRELPVLAEINDAFVRHFPSSVLRFERDATPDLLTKLRQGDLSLAVVLAPFDHAELDVQFLAEAQAHYLVPAEHPLAGAPEITPAMLDGFHVGVVNRTIHPEWFHDVMKPLEAAGAILDQVPDSDTGAMRDYANNLRRIVLRFSEPHDLTPSDQLNICSAAGLPKAAVYLVKLKNLYARGADRYWSLAAQSPARRSRPDRAPAP